MIGEIPEIRKEIEKVKDYILSRKGEPGK